ncbi:MAG: MFS transporter [Nitrososphaerota archaeon]
MTDTDPALMLGESRAASRKTGKRNHWRLLRLAAIDLGPLRSHRDFRLFFIGRAITNLGTMVSTVAVMYQVFALTRSPLAVGVFGIVEFAPMLLFAFVGGALADALDRRWIAQFTELALAVLSGLLLINALQPMPRLWALYLVSMVAAALSALQRPALSALLPRIVERDEIVAAAALMKALQSIGQILGPAIAGILIAYAGLPVVYGIDVASFVVSLLALRLMHAVPPPSNAGRPSIRSIFDGLSFLRGQPLLLSTYLVDMIGTFFGFPTALLPAFAVFFTRGNSGIPAASALGLLYAAPAVGALLAAVSSGWTRHVHRHGLGVMLAVMVWGIASVGLGLAPSLPLAFTCLALVGGANMVSGVFRSAISNATIPDALRGRLAGVELIAYTSGPVLGDVEAGAVATIFTPQISAFSGGVLCLLGVSLLMLALPGLRRYDHRDSRSAANG